MKNRTVNRRALEGTFQALLDIVGAFEVQSMTADDVTAPGQSILKNERDFNAREREAAPMDFEVIHWCQQAKKLSESNKAH